MAAKPMLGRAPSGGSPVRGRWYYAYVIGLVGFVAVRMTHRAPLLLVAVPEALPDLWILAVLALAVDTPVARMRGWGGETVLTSVTFCVALSYVIGNDAGLVTQVAAVVVASSFNWRGPWPLLFDIGRYGSALAAFSIVVGWFGRVPVSRSDPAALLKVLIATLVWYAAFRLTTGVGVWLRDGGRWSRALRGTLPEALAVAALLSLSVMLLGFIYRNVWLIPLILIPIAAVSLMSQSYWQLQQKALSDPLTGLPSRLALEAAVKEPIERCVADQDGAGAAALLNVNVAQLGQINDALGHRVGDEVLMAVGHRVASLSGPDVSVAHLHGDEFAVFVWPIADGEEAITRAEAVHSLFDKPIPVEDLPLLVSVSVGISLCPEQGTNFDLLLRHADAALGQAKNLPSGIGIFQSDQDVLTADQLALVTDLGRALDDPGSTSIVPFYQPQVDMASQQVVGAEALLRWRHPTRGMVSPEQLVRVAEHSPVMRKISMSIMDQVLTQLASWQSDDSALVFSVNVSVRDLHSIEFVEWLAARMRQRNVDPSRLKVELTETALMSQTGSVLDSLTALNRLGVGTSLDDFGTGFSSLQHVRQLPLTELKIDKSFVQSMTARREEASIVKAVIDMGRELGLDVVAEGVENSQTREALLKAGCRLAQGWYYAKPMPAEEFAHWCHEWAARGPSNSPSADYRR